MIGRKKTIEEVKEHAEKFGYEVLSNEYVNTFTKLEFRCPKGHKFEMRQNDFHQNQRCPVCAVNKKRKTIEEVRGDIESKGYKLLSTGYVNHWTNLDLECPVGHKFETNLSRFQQEHGCPKCKNEKQKERMLNGGAAYIRSFIKNPSKPQVELFHLVQELHSDTVLEYSCLNYSIDIVVPQLSLAIEYDGSYYHQDERYDQKRQKELEAESWIFLRYRDYIPTKEELTRDINKLLEQREEKIAR